MGEWEGADGARVRQEAGLVGQAQGGCRGGRDWMGWDPTLPIADAQRVQAAA